MRVMRDTVNGPELVAELEVPSDCSDVNAFLESVGRQQRSGGMHVTRKDSDGHYDNLMHDDLIRLQYNGGTNIAKVSFTHSRFYTF